MIPMILVSCIERINFEATHSRRFLSCISVRILLGICSRMLALSAPLLLRHNSSTYYRAKCLMGCLSSLFLNTPESLSIGGYCKHNVNRSLRAGTAKPVLKIILRTYLADCNSRILCKRKTPLLFVTCKVITC